MYKFSLQRGPARMFFQALLWFSTDLLTPVLHCDSYGVWGGVSAEVEFGTFWP